jgi:hypothetical protein
VGWWRSLFAEVFPSWHERRLLSRLQADNEANLDALQRLRRKIAMQDKDEKHRATHDRPNSNQRVDPSRVEAPAASRQVSTESSEQAKKSAADRGAL